VVWKAISLYEGRVGEAKGRRGFSSQRCCSISHVLQLDSRLEDVFVLIEQD
jgi:hypothetical protein